MVKVLWFKFQQCFAPFTMSVYEGSSKADTFRHISNHDFWSPQLQKCIRYEGHSFFENVQNFIYISKIRKKIQKMFFLLQTYSSESAALNCLY